MKFLLNFHKNTEHRASQPLRRHKSHPFTGPADATHQPSNHRAPSHKRKSHAAHAAAPGSSTAPRRRPVAPPHRTSYSAAVTHNPMSSCSTAAPHLQLFRCRHAQCCRLAPEILRCGGVPLPPRTHKKP
ncbi:hypothetical protein ACSQ67_001740 [Phaseolus vulgaris]